jgi:hypothetical protein
MTEIIGKSEDDARRYLETHGKKLRVIERDRDPYLFTCDYLDERVNVRVHQGVISSIAFVG